MNSEQRPFIKTRKDPRTESSTSRGQYLLKDEIYPGPNRWWKLDEWIKKPENFVKNKMGEPVPMSRSNAYRVFFDFYFEHNK